MKKYILISCLICLLSSCKEKTKLQSITIGTFSTAIDYAPFYIAKQQGWFADSEILKDIPIKYQEYGDRPSFSADIESESLHLLFAAEPPIILTKAQGVNLKISGLSCSLRQEILVQKDAPYNKITDIDKCKIAVLQSTSSHYGLLKIIEDYNVQELVTVIQANPPEAKDLFEKKDIDGWAVWPPHVEEQLINGTGKILEGGEATIQSVMSIPDFVYNKYPEVAKEFCRILNKSKQWILDHPDESKNIVAKEIQKEYEVVALAWPKHNWSATLNSSIVTDIQNKSKFLAEQKETRNNIEVNISKDLLRQCQN